jgi:hypothetical protein
MIIEVALIAAGPGSGRLKPAALSSWRRDRLPAQTKTSNQKALATTAMPRLLLQVFLSEL